MADIRLTAAPVLGTDTSIGENRIVERGDLGLVSVAIPLGGEEARAGALQGGWSLAMPDAALSTGDEDMRAIRTGPDQIMLVFAGAATDRAARLRERLAGAAYTTDQTDAWFALEISGPDTLAALERLFPLDVARFGIGAAGRSLVHHIAATLVRLGPDRFLLLSARSSAGSFLRSVEQTFSLGLNPRPAR